MHYSMLEKSELKIIGIQLDRTNLHQIAKCVADLFGLPQDEVLVIDVRNGEVALDILTDTVDPHAFVGKEKVLLQKIQEIPGVQLAEDARITSDGMLGWIAFEADQEEIDQSLARADEMSRRIMETVAKRVLVYPSGTEVLNGEIEDTNTPMLIAALREAGYQAEAGEILPDEEDTIVMKLRQAVERGYGIVITTGGVGAEDKDHSVESVQRLDPEAAAPYIVKFEQGHGRHHKDGIRIGVGQYEHARLVNLPGPNDEVALCIPILIDALQNGLSKEHMAENLANALRVRLQEKMKQNHRHKVIREDGQTT